MTITLRIKGKAREFVTGFVTARMVRRSIALTENTDFTDLSSEDLDHLVDYVVDLFGQQFTRDDLYDGLSSKDLIPTITRCFREVVGTVAETESSEEIREDAENSKEKND